MDEMTLLIEIPGKPERHNLEGYIDKMALPGKARPYEIMAVKLPHKFRAKVTETKVIVGKAGDYLIRDSQGNYSIIPGDCFGELFQILAREAEKGLSDEKDVDLPDTDSDDSDDATGVSDDGAEAESAGTPGPNAKRGKHAGRTKADR